MHYKNRFGKWCPWLSLIFNVILKISRWLTDILDSSFSVSLGCLLLCLLLCFSPALPRIPDYWVRYKLRMAMTYQESIWLPYFPGISTVLTRCWNVRRGKCESIDYCMMHFSAVSNNEMCETGLYSPHWGHMKFVCFSYSTVYTMFPVFSLVLDKDVKSEVAMLYPELYKDLLKVFNKCSHAGFQYRNVYDCEVLM